MDIEAWWLLFLPLFFGLGWFAARAESKRQIAETKALPQSYFKGLNHLLNEEPDQAIDALIDVARVDTGTIDLYFALGNLFGQRGEIERSIRVYQSLLERADLPDDARQMALSKLGEAFLKGGLFDRAEASFKQLLNGPQHAHAQTQLLYIYQSQQEWGQAVDVAQGMVKTEENTVALTHFHCELAVQAMQKKDWLVAERELNQAQTLRPLSMRVQLLKGRWYAQQGRTDEALAVWRQLAEAQPNSVPLLVDDAMAVFEARGEMPQGVALLYDNALKTGSFDVLNAWLNAQTKIGSEAETLTLLNNIFIQHPSLNALDKLLSKRLAASGDEAVQGESAMIQKLIKKQVQRLSKYRCEHCGFEAARYYWQCPACTRWESYPPKRLEELELAQRSRGQMNGY
ncbi:Lipopolysaccharide assembly protein B [Ephemeroptericola cinctiostellae]|uniref:Lipopolysaccharide assembly protein B n=1 Tax=Ephemeroptericola cinctiostellae TaxID=2268024 RepID=A0A345D7P9_9BURK|nr:tetratricopeptide repeat protein [Ephemeroptericola cinctiostellae]AXF84387.1 Lipopolysaccharide assembly protein B [Ephemeroptericola cinctiostellae]